MRFEQMTIIQDGVPRYGANARTHTFIISHEPNLGGWLASWKNVNLHNGAAVRVEGEPFATRHQAEAACRRTLKNLLQKN